jgi:hypothetical protein
VEERSVSAVTELHGRSIIDLIRAMVRLWAVFGGTLRAAFPAEVSGALDVLAASLGALEALNAPGPL